MKAHIISGFLGAGKTTFLNKYLPLLKRKVVVIENEFGDISVATNLIEKDVPVHEIYAGCICCTLAGNFQRGIKEISDKFSPDHIVIEPSGVCKLFDVINACYLAQRVEKIDLEIERLIVLVDAESCRDFLEDFGEFYSNQIEHAKLILLSHLHMIDEIEKTVVVDILKEKNRDALIYEADWRMLDEQALLELVELSEDYGKIKFKIDKGNIPADKVFSSLVIDVSEDINKENLELALNTIKEEKFGIIRAKGAILSGFVVLLEYAGIKMQDLEKILIAGQFGAHLPADILTGVGILPKEVEDKISYVGNSSKTGAYIALMSKNARTEIEELAKKIEYFELAETNDYERVFTQSLIFPKFDV